VIQVRAVTTTARPYLDAVTAPVDAMSAPDRIRPSMSVIVPTRNRADLLPRLVSALREQTLDNAEWIFVDDASVDATGSVLEMLRGDDQRLVAHRLARQCGPARARNVGWRAARAPYVAFLDDDCVPQPGWLAELEARHAEGWEVVQGRTEPAVENYFAWPTFARSVSVRRLSYFFESCNIAYSRELLDRVGGFDEAFGVSRGGAPNGEDADLGWRALEAGATVTFAADALVNHDVVRLGFGKALLGKLRSYRMVYVVRRHPGLRAHLPGRYFFSSTHPWFLVAAVGLAAGVAAGGAVGFSVAAAGVLLYAWFRLKKRRLPGLRRHQPLIIAAAFVLDLADVMVLAAGSVRWRRLLL
jgi:glycosyltransferase involved in cell wall biosynthesis